MLFSSENVDNMSLCPFASGSHSPQRSCVQSTEAFGIISLQFLREGGAIRTRKSGHYSTPPWYLAATCSVSASPEEYRKLDWSGR